MTDNLISWEEAVLWLRAQPDRRELVRACYFDDPLGEAADRYYNSLEWKEVRKILSGLPSGKAMDVGAGRGISSYALARDGWNVTALEPDPSEIVGAGAIRKLFAEKGLEIRVAEGEGEKLPFDDNVFDVVYARQALHHARDLAKMCAEIIRVLKRGGMFIATREHVISKPEDLNRFLNSHPLHRLYGGENAYTLDEYETALRGAGLTIKVLGPYDSDINLFPSNKNELRKRFSVKLGFDIPAFAFRIITFILNLRENTPGRLYSFVGVKK